MQYSLIKEIFTFSPLSIFNTNRMNNATIIKVPTTARKTLNQNKNWLRGEIVILEKKA